ncbi:unnamed protein product [Parascedosporium putredinis]|uniref:CAIB/BAIF family enzyme n=1 Tax=Parascedosporium putredinis TaxID=1442378 RepID=A0A9P1H3Z1_9PEZI|nr:unnamed protein product [Parascedosporium putredinis]CAI7997719.1 unnamed protein product [Parascedosporium putredinis]
MDDKRKPGGLSPGRPPPHPPPEAILRLILCQVERTCDAERPGTGHFDVTLEGIKVLDMTRVLAGPYCTQILGDLGAEVIKIEHPVRGDDTRSWGPPYAGYTPESEFEGPGESAYYLTHPQGVEILHKLAAQADVLVENYLPGTLRKYGLDYETIHKINPGLIYTSITGYGQTGPYSNRAGYDVMVEAEFGLMHITGNRDGPPVKVGVAVTDLTTGLYASNSIMAALLSRGRSGKGQHLDVALSDCQTATLANIASSCLISGKKDSGRWGTAHPSIVPYRAFATKDGDILLGGGNDRLFGILCDNVGRPEWKTDPRYSTNAERVRNRADLEVMIEDLTRQKTTAEWLAVFEGKGMPYAAINDVQAALEHEHTKARNMVVEVDHPACGPIKMVNTPSSEHTDEILTSYLGLSADEVKGLKSQGVTRHPPSRICGGPDAGARHAAIRSGQSPPAHGGRRAAHRVSPVVALPSASTPSPTETPAARRPYQPQFTAMTATILERIRNGNASVSSAVAGAQAAGVVQLSRAKYEDARRRLVETLKTSDSIELPAVPTRRVKGVAPTPAPGSRPASAVSTPTQGALKRKRSHLDAAAAAVAQDHGSPFSDLDLDGPQLRKMAPRPPSGRRRPRTMVPPAPPPSGAAGELAPLCNPPEVVKAYKADRTRFRCFGCLEEARQMAEYQKAKAEFAQLKRQHEIAKTKERVLASLPVGAAFDKPEAIGFAAGSASDVTRADYFSALPRRDLLSLLAFCDKLRPNLLVDLLVTATKKHPELPIFSSPDWAAQVTAGASRPRTLSIDPGPEKRGVDSPIPSHTAPNPPLSTPQLTAAMKQAAPPKQTQTGMYATLPPESEDAEHLIDEDAGGAFQGFAIKSEPNDSVRLEPTVCC